MFFIKQVTILFLTTGLFNQLGLQKPEMFKNLRYLLTGGDVISKLSAKKIIDFFKKSYYHLISIGQIKTYA